MSNAVLDQFAIDLENLEDETLLNVPPHLFIFAGAIFKGQKSDDVEGRNMLGGGYEPRLHCTMSARVAQFAALPEANDEVQLVEDRRLVTCQIIGEGSVRQRQEGLKIDFDLTMVRSDAEKFYELTDTGLYVLTDDGQRIEVTL